MIRLLFLMFLVPIQLLAQEVHRFSGFFQEAGSEPSSYFMQFTLQDSKISGYALSRYLEGSRMICGIKGTQSPSSGLNIEEIEVPEFPDTGINLICFFKAHLTLGLVDGKQCWSGPFEGHLANGAPCLTGFMSLTEGAAPLTDIVFPSSPPQPTTHSSPPLIKPKPQATITFVTKPTAQVILPSATVDSKVCVRDYEWHSDSLALEIWDGWTVDGDVVSLELNGQTLLNHVKLSEVKLHFVVPLSKGKNTLLLSLHEEGFDPPNTPNLVLHDGTSIYELGVSGASGEKVRFCINLGKQP